jgi:hypothetical protein
MRPMTSPQRRSRRWQSIAVFVGAAALAALIGLPKLLANDGDPTALLNVGERAASRPFIEQHFDDPVLARGWGHDGQQFYVLAATFPHLDEAEGDVDKLRYRARRVLLPAVVAPAPDGAPTVWAMAMVNLVAIGAAALAVARLAERLGVSRWLGLSVGVTPALVDSLQGSLADAAAFALALWGVVLCRSRPWLAATLLTLAVLARETTIVVALACALLAHGGRRALMLAPVAVYGVWTLLVAAWLPADDPSGSFIDDATAQLTWPFAGWLDTGSTEAIAIGVALLLASLIAAAMLWDRLPEISLWLAADAFLLTLANQGVAERPANLARVAPLALPALVLTIASAWPRRRRPAPSPAAPVSA